jgi:poly(A) polymerase
VEAGRGSLLLRAALLEQPLAPGWQEDLARGAAASFPVKAADLMQDYAGAAIGKRLKQLEAAWISSGFALERAELLALPD